MNKNRTLAAIGLSDPDLAHLRLLLRKATTRLDAAWSWGAEGAADLLIIDTTSLAGQMAYVRAHAAGVRCGLLGNVVDVAPSDSVLAQPLALEDVVHLLNQGGPLPTPGLGAAHSHDFYFQDLDDAAHTDDSMLRPALTEVSAPAPVPLSLLAPEEEPAPGLDELFRADPADQSAHAQIPVQLDDNTAIDTPRAAPTERSEARSAERSAVPDQAAPYPFETPAPGAGRGTDGKSHDLTEYLSGSLLGGPAQISLPDCAALILDPKQQAFHFNGSRTELEAYCLTPLRHAEWTRLTTVDLERLRLQHPAQPYMRLVWLCTLLRSNGHLARHLDPGGTYRLLRWLELGAEFRRHLRIATALMQPARLHEIAASSDASMADVFDVINAYDAIGLLEWTPRPPRERNDEPATATGFFDRLRWNKGKS